MSKPRASNRRSTLLCLVLLLLWQQPQAKGAADLQQHIDALAADRQLYITDPLALQEAVRSDQPTPEWYRVSFALLLRKSEFENYLPSWKFFVPPQLHADAVLLNNSDAETFADTTSHITVEVDWSQQFLASRSIHDSDHPLLLPELKSIPHHADLEASLFKWIGYDNYEFFNIPVGEFAVFDRAMVLEVRHSDEDYERTGMNSASDLWELNGASHLLDSDRQLMEQLLTSDSQEFRTRLNLEELLFETISFDALALLLPSAADDTDEQLSQLTLRQRRIQERQLRRRQELLFEPPQLLTEIEDNYFQSVEALLQGRELRVLKASSWVMPVLSYEQMPAFHISLDYSDLSLGSDEFSGHVSGTIKFFQREFLHTEVAVALELHEERCELDCGEEPIDAEIDVPDEDDRVQRVLSPSIRKHIAELRKITKSFTPKSWRETLSPAVTFAESAALNDPVVATEQPQQQTLDSQNTTRRIYAPILLSFERAQLPENLALRDFDIDIPPPAPSFSLANLTLTNIASSRVDPANVHLFEHPVLPLLVLIERIEPQ